MILVVGLGNPGRKFKKTRHNVGFWVIDELRKNSDLSPFKMSKKFNSLFSEGFLKKKKVLLLKPQTFMNNSGKAVKMLYTKYKTSNTNLWVIHDDIDIPLGKIKIVKNRGAAGHKGVQSIIDELNTKNFVRFRIGIKPASNQLSSKSLEKFVLEKFTKEEEKIIKEVIKKTIEAIEFAITKGIGKTMQKFNKIKIKFNK